MNGSTTVLYGTKDGIARITISRPEKLNALDRQTVQEIGRVVASAGQDPSIGVLIVTGAGENAFVAGADIGELPSQTPVEGTASARAGQAALDPREPPSAGGAARGGRRTRAGGPGMTVAV